MPRLFAEIKDGQLIPKWFGFVRYDFNRDVRIYAPVPLNWLMMFYTWLRILLQHKVSWWLRRKTGAQERYRELRQARDAGYREGYQDGQVYG